MLPLGLCEGVPRQSSPATSVSSLLMSHWNGSSLLGSLKLLLLRCLLIDSLQLQSVDCAPPGHQLISWDMLWRGAGEDIAGFGWDKTAWRWANAVGDTKPASRAKPVVLVVFAPHTVVETKGEPFFDVAGLPSELLESRNSVFALHCHGQDPSMADKGKVPQLFGKVL